MPENKSRVLFTSILLILFSTLMIFMMLPYILRSRIENNAFNQCLKENQQISDGDKFLLINTDNHMSLTNHREIMQKHGFTVYAISESSSDSNILIKAQPDQSNPSQIARSFCELKMFPGITNVEWQVVK